MSTPHLSRCALVFIFAFAPKLALSKGLSPSRPATVPADRIINFYENRLRLSKIKGPQIIPSISVLESRNLDSQIDWKVVPETKIEDLTIQFRSTRDVKILKDQEQRDRRITWLYPDDGCYARAELVVDQLEDQNSVVPMKIFAFGNLNVATKNSPAGTVTWWYHVAPILRVGDTVYVMDASIDPTAPLPVAEWTKRMGGGEIRLSICTTHAYDPNSDCNAVSPTRHDQAIVDEVTLLGMEWNRVQELGRNPENELGNLPPWVPAVRLSVE